MIGFSLDRFHHASATLSIFAGCQDLYSVLASDLNNGLMGLYFKANIVFGHFDQEGTVGSFRHVQDFEIRGQCP